MSFKKILKLSSDVLLNSQPDIESSIRTYHAASSSLYNKQVFRLELDARLRWCTLLLEQNDLRVELFIASHQVFLTFSQIEIS